MKIRKSRESQTENGPPKGTATVWMENTIVKVSRPLNFFECLSLLPSEILLKTQ